MRKRNRSRRRKRTRGGFGLWGTKSTGAKMVDPTTGIQQIQNLSTGSHIIKPGGMGSTPQKKAGIGMPAGMKMVDPQTGGPARDVRKELMKIENKPGDTTTRAGIADRAASHALTNPGFMRLGGSRRRKRTMKR